MATAPALPSELDQALRALQPYFRRVVAFNFGYGVLSLTPIFFVVAIFSMAITSRSSTTLGMLLLLALLAYGVAEGLHWAASETLREASGVLNSRLAVRVFGLVYASQLRTQHRGAATAMTDFRRFCDFLQTPAAIAVFEAPVALVYLVTLGFLSPMLLAFALAGLLLQSALTWLNERSTHALLGEANQHAAHAQTTLESLLRNVEVVQAMGMADALRRRWESLQQRAVRLQWQASESAGLYQALARLASASVSSLMLGLGAWMLISDRLDGGAPVVIAAYMLSAKAMAPLVQLIGNWKNVTSAFDARGRLLHWLREVPAPADSMPLPAPSGHLQVEQVVVSVPGRATPLLRGVQFGLAPGELLAVIGTSGSGKSTLARVLVGIWPATQGKVRLDGADVFGWNKAELGPHIGYVGQTVDLIEGTLAENIARFGVPDPALLQAAAEAVGLHAAILALPLGYETPVGAEGRHFSGGQRQRIALARALYGDPALVVLDEPNASLDEAGDAQLSVTLQALRARGAAVVLITHRPGALNLADRILVLRDGVQQAFGPRDEVLALIRRAVHLPPQGARHG